MSDFVWVEESDFKKIQVDDLIRIENGNFIHQFVVDRIKLEKTHANFFDHYGREFYAFPGTKLFCERPVALPTEPGVYLGRNDSIWWHDTDWGGDCKWLTDGKPYPKDKARTYAPFRRLRPVDEVRKETAKSIWESLNTIALYRYSRDKPHTTNFYTSDYENLFRAFGVLS